MQKLTFGQLKRMLDPLRKDGMVNERNDEDPVTLADVPPSLIDDLKKLGCEFDDSTSIPRSEGLPYVYVFAPAWGHVPKKAVSTAVSSAGWYIVDTEPPYKGEPRFTFWISPYKDPHEPGVDQFERIINADRKKRKEREEEWEKQDDEFDDDDEIRRMTGGGPLYESSSDVWSVKDFKVGDKVEVKNHIVYKDEWLDGEVVKADPRGITIKWEHFGSDLLRIPARYLSKDSIRKVETSDEEDEIFVR